MFGVSPVSKNGLLDATTRVPAVLGLNPLGPYFTTHGLAPPVHDTFTELLFELNEVNPVGLGQVGVS